MPSLYFGRFEERQTLLEDRGFVWLEVFDTFEQQTAWLQLLQPGLPLLHRQALEQAIPRLNGLAFGTSLLKYQRLCQNEQHLALIYDTCPVNTGLEQLLPHFEPQYRLASCKALIEALHSAHRESVYLGGLSERLIVPYKQGVAVAGLGYGALLEVNPKLPSGVHGATVAPELQNKGKMSVASDLYSVAVLLEGVLEGFERTAWYGRATQVNPQARFQKARDALEELKKDIAPLQVLHKAPTAKGSQRLTSEVALTPLVELVPLESMRVPLPSVPKAVPHTPVSAAQQIKETFSQQAVRPTLVQTLEGHRGWVMSLAFSPDGSSLLTGSTDRTVRLWNVSTGDVQLILQGHTDTVISAEFSADESKILTASRDNTIRLWDAHTGELLQVLTGHTQWIGAATFSGDGSKILTGSWDKTVRLWDTSSGRPVRTLINGNSPFRAVAFNFDESKVFAAAQDNIEIWDVLSGELLETLEGHTNWITSLYLNSQRSRMVTTSWDETARIWDVGTGQTQCVLVGHTDPVHSAVFSPDGSLVLTGSWDGTARGWNAQTGQPSFVLEGHLGGIHAVAFSKDGSKIMTGSRDQTVKVWNVEERT